MSYLDNGDWSSEEKRIKILPILIFLRSIFSYLDVGELGFNLKTGDLASRESSASIEMSSVLLLFWRSCTISVFKMKTRPTFTSEKVKGILRNRRMATFSFQTIASLVDLRFHPSGQTMTAAQDNINATDIGHWAGVRIQHCFCIRLHEFY